MKKAMKQSTLVNTFSILSVVLLAGVLACTLLAYFMNSAVTEKNNGRIELTKNANRFLNGSDYLVNEARAFAATGDAIHYENYWNEVDNLKNTEISVENMKEIGITAVEQEKIDQMLNISNELIPLEESAMQDAMAGKTKEALDYVYGEAYKAGLNKISTLQTEFLTMLEERTQGEVNALSSKVLLAQIFLFVMVITVAAMQIVTFSTIRKKVIKPVLDIEKEMGHIARGELSFEFKLEPDTSEIGMLIDSIHNTRATLRRYIGDISSKLSKISERNVDLDVELTYIGDFKPIQEELKTIIRSLNATVSLINTAAEQVNVGSSQVSSGAQALAAGSTEQAAAVEELSASVERVAEQADENARNVNDANAFVEKTGVGVAAGNAHMEQLNDAMKGISSASSEIVSITKVIQDIAFQTNILALNAAIEAARAGSAGKGFAVVADEVRSLAAKSGEAAKQTAELIENSVARVKGGMRIAEQTAEVLKEVGINSVNVTESFAKIERASTEQSAAIEQIRQGLAQVSSVVQTNAATAEENSATAEEMSAQAATLSDEVRKFKLKKDTQYSMKVTF